MNPNKDQYGDVSLPKPKDKLSSVDYGIYLKLCSSLDENNKWRKLVEITSQSLSSSSVRFPLREYERKASPAKAFLDQLCILSVTVEVLSLLLKKCELYDEVLAIQENEEVTLVKDLTADNLNVSWDGSARLCCAFDGIPPPLLQWYLNGGLLEGQNESTLIIPKFTDKNAGDYYCKATQTLKHGRIATMRTNTVTLNLARSAPAITKEPEDLQIVPGSVAKFECEAEGWPKPSFVWFKDNEALPMRGNILEISNTASEYEGNYHCLALNEVGMARSREAVLRVSNGSPKILIHPHLPNNEPVAVGAKLVLECKASGQAPLKHHWYCNGTLIDNHSGSTLIFEAGPYKESTHLQVKCRVSNDYGEAESRPVKIIVNTLKIQKHYVASTKVALLIGNSRYEHWSDLAKPLFDVAVLSSELEKQEFRVLPLCNLNRKEIISAVRLLADFVLEKSYVVVYLAGHGFHLNGNDYFLPVDSTCDNDLSPSGYVDINEIISLVQEKNPSLLLMLVDLCRVKPSVQIHLEPKPRVSRSNLAIGFATSELRKAFERSNDPNSVFVMHLKEYIAMRLPVIEMLKKTRQRMALMKMDAALKSDDDQLPVDYIYLTEDVSLSDPVDNELVGETEWNKWELQWRKLRSLPERNLRFYIDNLTEIFRLFPWFRNNLNSQLYLCVVVDGRSCPVKVAFSRLHRCFLNAMRILIEIDCPRRVRVREELFPVGALLCVQKTITEVNNLIKVELDVENLQKLEDSAKLRIYVEDQMVDVPLGMPLISRSGVLRE